MTTSTTTAYAYDLDGVYLAETTAHRDPLGEGYLLPAGATFAPPPTPGERQAAVWRDGGWTLVADHRGWKGYDASGAEVTITEVDVEPDAAWSTDPPADIALARAKAAMIARARRACEAAIIAGVASSALGVEHSYPTGATDQSNMVQAATTGGALWCADANGTWALVAHTRDQAAAVLADFVARRNTLQTRLADLVAAVEAATDDAAVRAIVWTDPTTEETPS